MTIVSIADILSDLHRMRLAIAAAGIDCQSHQQSLLIRHGSVRGVKFGVYNTIRRLKLRNQWKRDYFAEDEHKVVVYTTSCAIVRRPWERCRRAIDLLTAFGCNFECRDLYLRVGYYRELCNRLGHSDTMVDIYDRLPLVYVAGELFGDEQTLEQWNERGELRQVLADFVTHPHQHNCTDCFGLRHLNCDVCRGGKRSPLRFGLRCVRCDDNGIVECRRCRSLNC